MRLHTDPARYAPAAPRGRASLLAAMLLLSACNYRPHSVGQEDVLIILVSDEDRPLLQPLLMNIFDREMATPSGEPYFKVKIVPPDEFETYRKYHSLIVAAVANPIDSTGDVLVRGVLGQQRSLEAEAGGNPIFMIHDLFAQGQILMGLLALGDWIFDQFETQLRLRQSAYIFRYGDHGELSDSLEIEHGWRMRLEPDYLRIKDRPEDRFVWLGRGYPYRWLSVHWVEGADSVKIDRQWAWLRMEHIAGNLFRDIYIDSLFRSEALGMENGHTIFMLKGVWGHKLITAGGPFITYIFRDREQNRVYLISGLVFHPSGSKGLLIKRQEVIMRTFHTFSQPPGKGVGGPQNLTRMIRNQRREPVAGAGISGSGSGSGREELSVFSHQTSVTPSPPAGGSKGGKGSGS